LPMDVSHRGTASRLTEHVDNLLLGKLRSLHRSAPLAQDRRNRSLTPVQAAVVFRGDVTRLVS
jgi:hypothetical protein